MGQKIKTYLIYAALVIAVTGVSTVFGVISVVLYQVYFGDVSELKKSTILARINEQTTIYTLDEKTRVGSFFEDAHRSYIPIDEVPAHMIRAMVASEDKNFYSHFGIDPVAIAIAFGDGVVNGMRFRRGGSTITQQTVKNIMDRREHTFKRKFKEMIRALQLERMYSKEQILEFYLNQFHVTANGKGVGIGAQYYFNKDVRDLDLVEAAFIAGSVKAPSKYNPFIKYTIENRENAWLEANRRKNYVLRRMYEQGWITEEELKEAWKKKVPFNQGEFRTREVALVSLIRSQLNKKEILKALNMDSAQELNHAGLRIFTTLDAELQQEAQLNMRRNLSRLEYILQGFRIESEEEFRPLRSLEVNQFYYGRVEKIEKGDDPKIHLDFGLPKGVIPKDSLMRTAKILNLPTYRGDQHHLKEILEQTKEGDVLFVEVMEYDPESHQAVVELRIRPDINGGLIAIDEGEIRSVVAGFDNQGFNRAMFATRQPGSVFKSVIYFAALQLGWTVLDRLDNERRIFPFQGDYYIPRPDHKSPYNDVSLLWAGVTSENLATVYLTSNLLEKLNFDEFRTLLGAMDLLPTEDESPRDYHYRVARRVGVQLDNSGIREYMLKRVIEDMRPDLIFSGRMDLLRDLSKLWFGRGYRAAMQNVMAMEEEDISPQEKALRLNLLKRNFERMNIMADTMESDWQQLADHTSQLGAESVLVNPSLTPIVARFRVMNTVGGRPTLAYVRELPGEEFIPTEEVDKITLEPPPGRALNPLDIQAIWGNFDGFGGADIQMEDVLLAGFLPVRYFKRIQDLLEQRFQEVVAQKDRYSLFQYFNHHDFKISVGLHYLRDLTRSMGVYSNLEPVLSFGLGTNDVSVAEVAKIYQTFTNGKIYRFYEEGPMNQLNLIRRIEDRDGNVVFEPKKEEFQLTDPCYASQMSEILEKVVTHGTGRRARGELFVDLADMVDTESKRTGKVRVPAYGKTGTTNDYTTAYFAGFVPYPTSSRSPLNTMNDSMAIASYVGYDLNHSMRRGPFRISGAYGALPIWSDFAKSMIKVKSYVDFIDKFDLSMLTRQVWPVASHKCTTRVRVDLPRGTVLVDNRDDRENFDFTNFEKDGEVFMNEFARNQSVKSFLNLATHRQNGALNPMRAFQPFLKPDVDPLDPKVIRGLPELEEDEMDELSEDSGVDAANYTAPKPTSNTRTSGESDLDLPRSRAQDEQGADWSEAQPPVMAPERRKQPSPSTVSPSPVQPSSTADEPDFSEPEGFEEGELW
ncbi:MAG: transglycosylase domain-containing protein [Oligoflexus sp.]